MDESASRKKNKRVACMKWIGSPSFYLLCNFLLSQWGDWMWQFSAGLYLVHLSEGQLRLAAVFGFTGGTSVLLFGGIIGDWVDKNERLKVVRVSLFIQNLSVALSAFCICIVLAFEPTVPELSSGYLGRYLMETAIVLLAVLAQLASVAYKIAIEKDWIVVIAAGKSTLLSNLNAITRSLDLACKVVSPLTVGFIMSYFSMFVSAIVIAAWNVISVFIEYAILSHIYRGVPQLAVKEGIKMDENKNIEMNDLHDQENLTLKDRGDKANADETAKPASEKECMLEKDILEITRNEKFVQESSSRGCLKKIFNPIFLLFSGWKTYAQQSVVFAGISLSCLYMTVLGFDSITLGYIYANDISEFLVGVCMALAGVTGIIGAFLFTRMAKRFGLERTGVFAFVAELFCLVLAVASVWAPGSKFNLQAVFASTSGNSLLDNNTTFINPTSPRTLPQVQSDPPEDIDSLIFGNFSEGILDTSNFLNISESTWDKTSFPSSNISMLLLLVGIIASRVGLWMADLVVTQLMQESIAEKERGVVNGVQNSLNMFMDMLKFILVILLPQIQIFGLHILLSFTFILVGTAFFCFYTLQVRRKIADKVVQDVNIA